MIAKLPGISWLVTTTEPTALEKNPLDIFINLFTIHVSFFIIVIQTLILYHHDTSTIYAALEKNPLDVFINLFTIHVSFFIIVI